MTDPGNFEAGRVLQFNFSIRAVKNLPDDSAIRTISFSNLQCAQKRCRFFLQQSSKNDVEFEPRDHPATHHVRNLTRRPGFGGAAQRNIRGSRRWCSGSCKGAGGAVSSPSSDAASISGSEFHQCRHPAQGSEARRTREPTDPVFSGFRFARLLILKSRPSRRLSWLVTDV
jgi:hypothetical protein